MSITLKPKSVFIKDNKKVVGGGSDDTKKVRLFVDFKRLMSVNLIIKTYDPTPDESEKESEFKGVDISIYYPKKDDHYDRFKYLLESTKAYTIPHIKEQIPLFEEKKNTRNTVLYEKEKDNGIPKRKRLKKNTHEDSDSPEETSPKKKQKMKTSKIAEPEKKTSTLKVESPEKKIQPMKFSFGTSPHKKQLEQPKLIFQKQKQLERPKPIDRPYGVTAFRDMKTKKVDDLDKIFSDYSADAWLQDSSTIKIPSYNNRFTPKSSPPRPSSNTPTTPNRLIKTDLTPYRPTNDLDLTSPSQSVAGGMKNYGNTCYVNAVLQALLNLRPFTDDLKHLAQSRLKLPEKSFCRALLNLRADMTRRNVKRLIDPISVKEFAAKYSKIFEGSGQQDAHEFLMIIFFIIESETADAVKEDVGKDQVEKKVKEEMERLCIVNRNFGSTAEQKIVCRECRGDSASEMIFSHFPLDIVDGEVKEVEWKCEKCQLNTNGESHTSIVRLPRILILQLNRFVYREGGWNKDQSSVTFEKELKINPYLKANCKVKQPEPYDYPKEGDLQKQKEETSPKEDEDIRAAIELSLKENGRVVVDGKSSDRDESNVKRFVVDGKDRPSSSIRSPLLSSADSQKQAMKESERLQKEKEDREKEDLDEELRRVMELSAKTFREEERRRAQEIPTTYHLHSIIRHRGETTSSGHYVTDVYHPVEEKWLQYNDSTVKERPEERVMQENANAYLLVYVHEDSWLKRE
ncbi:ubiquitin specific peptidase 37 [Planoprotostelium fungivorum]|uniref:Ubiquitin carboxyl-terminal hydrolase n=1 Tax=Planoprotostelium fungivorum TaxID=1890364 RepID=A0A2P6NYF6_9EUKA|nr:ubiquitin specific peptidase 37 [Planoprotostelium fungivorum]